MLVSVHNLVAQTPAGSEDTVSISASTHINDAALILETYTMKYSKKKLINLSSYNGNINIPISNLPWDSALNIILLQNNLIRKDNVGFISIEDIPVPEVVAPKVVPNPLVGMAESKQIRIKAVAMLADRSFVRSMGIDWSSVLNGKITVNAGFDGAAQIVSPMTLSASGTADVGKYKVDISTLLKTLESNQKGNIIAQPTILVASGKNGYIQVGQDISVKTTDEAGNTMDTFFATGIIMDVTPTVVQINGEEVIHLKLTIERSSGVPNAVSTVIARSKSTTELVLFNNEETVIAGLFDTDDTQARSGIPILKDLPWWVFGIRYLTGYNSKEQKEREMVISLQAEIVDSAYERLLKSKSSSQE
jgi:type IV pilus assembly protein PilQ